MKLDRSRAAQQRRITKALSQIGLALPGSLTVRAYRCGKTNCRCRAEPPKLHGPYAFWTRKIDGKTVTRMLSEEELAEYQPLFDNARQLRALMNELQALTLEVVEATDGASSATGATKTPPMPRKTHRDPTSKKTQTR